MGTPVLAGRGNGIVTATGRRTMLGRTATLVQQPEETDFQKNIRRFSRFLVNVILLLTTFVFVVNTAMGRGWFDSLLFAVALAVGITPEVLPVIITMALASGALRMAREKVVVKRLMSVEDLGNVDVLCCDKTGTLSRGEFSLQHYVGVHGAPDSLVLLYGALAGAAAPGPPSCARNPTDQAVWSSPACAELQRRISDCRVLDLSPFDYSRRRSSVLVQDGPERMLLVKGAAEFLLPLCAKTYSTAGTSELNSPGREELDGMVRRYESEGLRVLAVAGKPMDAKTSSALDESGLILFGFLLFLDPSKPDATEALKQLAELGVGLKLLSGDSLEVTRRICHDVGLGLAGDRIVSGAELDRLDDAGLRRVINECDGFARITPEQKYRLVSALRAEGHVVGFLGDGVNDAPALRASDVGISVDSGTEVAKEAADIILLEKSLQVIADGIVAGRRTFAEHHQIHIEHGERQFRKHVHRGAVISGPRFHPPATLPDPA